ncbi:MAG: hypothetical protein IKL96_04110 [Kiritimatiellae bacterium]|nr:hypothetical protein [Kiritimatiellia bacterium]
MKMQWMKMMAICALALVAAPMFAQGAAVMPREQWLQKVGECGTNPATMSSVMSQLSADDQKDLIGKVNASISAMRGSAEQKAAAAIQANLAGIKAAMAQNKEKRAANAVIAEAFATLPPEYLPQFAEALSGPGGPLNRGKMEREKFITISTNTLHAISERCEKAENNGGVREAMAAIAFLQASNEKDPPKDLISTMLSQIPDAKTRDLAAKEWVDPALDKNYDPILAAANAGDEPDRAIVASIIAGGAAGNNGGNGGKAATGATTAKTGATGAGGKGDGVTSVLGEPGLPTPVMTTGGPDVGVAMLGELTTAKDGTPTGRMGAGSFEAPVMAGVGPNELAADIGVNRVPRALVNNKESPYYKHGRNGGVKEPEPTGYDGQGLNSH